MPPTSNEVRAIAHEVRSRAFDLLIEVSEQHEGVHVAVGAGLLEAFFQFMVMHYGPDQARTLSHEMIDQLDQAARGAFSQA